MFRVFRQYDGCDAEAVLICDSAERAMAWIEANGGTQSDTFPIDPETDGDQPAIGGVGYNLADSAEDGVTSPIAWIEAA